MAWVRIDHNAPFHPKLTRAGCEAFGFWVACLAYSNRWMTDGFIPERDLLMVFPAMERAHVLRVVGVLVEEGLLHVVGTPGKHVLERVPEQMPEQVPQHVASDDVTHSVMSDVKQNSSKTRETRTGWLIHDYEDFQPLRADVMRLRRTRSMAGRLGGIASNATRKGKRPKQFAQPDAGADAQALHMLVNHEANGDANGQAHAISSAQAPSRPSQVEASSNGMRTQRGVRGEMQPSLDGIPTFQIPASITAALDKSPRLGKTPKLRSPAYWQAEVRSRPGLDYAHCVLDAEAWLTANTRAQSMRDLARFMHSWLRRAFEEMRADA